MVCAGNGAPDATLNGKKEEMQMTDERQGPRRITKPKPYAELVTQAEKATRVIKDRELRYVAFERVLRHLLSGGDTATQRGARAAKQITRGNQR